jgi:inner membrane protein
MPDAIESDSSITPRQRGKCRIWGVNFREGFDLDTLTHALSGALLARATAGRASPPRSLPRRMAAGFFACAAPDLDFVVSFFGPMAYLQNHRGVTHSLLLMPLWGIAVAWLLAKLLRAPGGWRELYGISTMAIGAHIAGDVITSYGTMVPAPFSLWRAAIGTTFIIDLWFSGIILAGLIGSLLLRRSTVPSLAAFAFLLGYIGFQYVQREKALEFAVQYARERGLDNVSIDVHPRPPTAFNWTLFVSDDRMHRFAHVNLMREIPMSYREGDGFIARIDAPYRPLALAQWETRPRYGESELSKAAWSSPPLAVFRWFAEEPAFDGEEKGCAWYTDLRFLTPGRGDVAFRYGACREGEGWSLVR